MGFCKVGSTVRVVINVSHLLLKDGSSSSEAEATSSDAYSSDDDDNDDDDDDGPLFVDDNFDEDITGTNCPLPNPLPKTTKNEHAKIILTWLVYFILIWQYKNYVSDNGVEQLLKFFKEFLTCIGAALQSHLDVELVLMLAANLPTTLYSARKLLNINRDSFEQFVVCPKCSKLYQMDKILYNDGRKVCARTCTNVQFPNCRRARVCNTKLVKEVVLKDGTRKFYPLKTYCYTSICNSIETLLKRPGFEEECEAWRSRKTKEDLYGDVYDGSVWKSFGNWKSTRPFLNLPRSYGLMLNVDWFQPFERRKDLSVGVLYMVLMNLPRKIRFRRENVILVGIIPALDHEPKSLNYFLEPLVEELRGLWTGVQANTYNSPNEPVEIRAALLCCAADVPAARKLCGFLGHQANRGCSHCYKFFPGGFGESKDYSGFEDCESWPKRTAEQHRRDANIVKNCKSATASEKKASKLGTRYSILLELPYYSSITTCVVDPMYNLFLGTAKRVFSTWIEDGVVSKGDLKKIQERIESFCSSSDLGRLPGNISSNYGGYTAAQWKNFVLLYSMYVLKGVLPDIHLNYWQAFVLACRHLCQSCISNVDLTVAHRKLLDFLKAYERVNGKAAITPNMHLHMHIRECVQNYGSIYGFWLFSFERFNGIMGAFNTNGRGIEVQIMRKFTTSGILSNLLFSLPKQYEDLFLEQCRNILCADTTKVSDVLNPYALDLGMAATGPIPGRGAIWSNLSAFTIPSSYKLGSLDSDSKKLLGKVYRELYSQSIEVSTLFKKLSSVTVGGERYGSRLASRLGNYSRVMSSWCGQDGCIYPGNARPGLVRYYMEHSVEVDGEQLTHVFAVVDWLKPSQRDFGYQNPLSVWYAKQYELAGPAVFLPLQRVYSRFISVEELHDDVKYLVVSPVCRRIYL